MYQMVHLAIENRDGLTIAVVGAPLALMRSGASALTPHVVFMILGFQQNIQ